MKTLGLLLAAILVPGAMAMAIKEVEQQPEPPQFEPSADSRIWSALQPSKPDSFANMRPWNGTSPFLQRLQRFRKSLSFLESSQPIWYPCILCHVPPPGSILMPEDQKKNHFMDF